MHKKRKFSRIAGARRQMMFPQRKTGLRATNKRIQMQAIITKYLPPTNRRGSMVKATCERGSITVPWDSSLDTQENHEAACRAMCEQFDAEDRKEYGSTLGNWSRPKASGGLASGEWVHCFIPSSYVKAVAALPIAEATIERLAPAGSRATQGTRDVLAAAIAEVAS